MRLAFLAAVLLVQGVLVSSQEIPGPGMVVPPEVVKAVKAAYTAEARAAGIEGTVLVDALVLTDGTVSDDARVLESLDPEFGLDDAAVKASKQWTFKPATKGGRAVTARVVISRTFTLPPK